MTFIRQTDLARHQAGSLEQRIAAVRAAVIEAVGAGTTVLATHDTYALARGADGKLRTVGFQLREGRAADLAVTEAADVPVLAGYPLDRAAADDLRATVRALLSEGGVDRTRVRDLARMVRGNATYWVEEALARVEGDEDRPWWAYYAPQATLIREALHGSIRDIEAAVPRARFAKLAVGRLPEFAGEIRECLAQLEGVARGLFDDLTTDVAYHRETVDAVHRSLRDEARDLAETLAWVAQMDWAGKEPAVARAHDRIAARLRDGLVVQAHLRALTQEGTENNAPEN